MKLSDPQRARAVGHAVEAHLEDELRRIEPSAVVALGRGALDACHLIGDRAGSPLRRMLVEEARLSHHRLRVKDGPEVPLHVTYLPGKENERVGRGPLIHEDVGAAFDCLSGRAHCETVTRTGSAARQARGRGRLDKEDKEILRRLRASGLLPLPPSATMAEAVAELLRREEER